MCAVDLSGWRGRPRRGVRRVCASTQEHRDEQTVAERVAGQGRARPGERKRRVCIGPQVQHDTTNKQSGNAMIVKGPACFIFMRRV